MKMKQYRGKINVSEGREENCRRNVLELVTWCENYYIESREPLV